MTQTYSPMIEHSEHYWNIARQTDFHGTLIQPDGYSKHTGECGDTVEFYLRIRNDIVEQVRFRINGCVNTNACANAVSLLITDKPLDYAWSIGPEDIECYLGALPPEEKHCAELAAGALYQALRSYHKIKRSPWKKVYG